MPRKRFTNELGCTGVPPRPRVRYLNPPIWMEFGCGFVMMAQACVGFLTLGRVRPQWAFWFARRWPPKSDVSTTSSWETP